MKFGVLCKLDFAINSTLLKVHVSNGYHKGLIRLHNNILKMNYVCEAPNPPTNQKNKAKMAI